MCGIFAAINSTSVTESLLSGLSSLSYRGYDSAGIAIISDGKLERRRARGKLNQLEQLLSANPLEGNIGIAHTRWATHGLPNERNAHPHMTARVAVAHNGIVENYNALRERLSRKGYIFESETDSETIAQLITYYLDIGHKKEHALREALLEIDGSFGVAVIFSDDADDLYAARKGSPLVIGRGDNGYYVSSDENALGDHANAITHLQDGDIARLRQDTFDVFSFKGHPVNRLLHNIDLQEELSDKQGFAHFMEKEIFEQPEVFERSWQHYVNKTTGEIQLPHLPFKTSALTRITIIACGTSYFAGMVAKYWLEQLACIAVDLDIASEYRYRNTPVSHGSAALFISQSGETADTLAALEYCKAADQPCVSLVNKLTSTMAHESDAILPTLAGPEIGVASTKAFISQLTTLLIFAIAAAKESHQFNNEQEKEVFSNLLALPDLMRNFLGATQSIESIAKELKDVTNILYLGRGIAYPLAEEGALKLKEISYIHAEAYPAGELKHGPLALVDNNMPVVVIAPPDELFSKTLSNLREVASRGGKILLISDKEGIEQAKEFITYSIEMPKVDKIIQPILYTLPLQLLAYHISVLKGNDVDQPRNLAKSVTVE